MNKIFSSYLFSEPEEKKIIKNLNMILYDLYPVLFKKNFIEKKEKANFVKEHFYYLLL